MDEVDKSEPAEMVDTAATTVDKVKVSSGIVNAGKCKIILWGKRVGIVGLVFITSLMETPKPNLSAMWVQIKGQGDKIIPKFQMSFQEIVNNIFKSFLDFGNLLVAQLIVVFPS